jgi:outer membrane cobalamin receptor
MRLASVVVVSAIGVSLAACVRVAAQSEVGGLADQSVITRDDIERIRAATALDIVQRYRADVLTARAPSSVLLNKHIHPVVFLNEQFYGAIDELRNVPADGVQEIHVFTGPDAVTKFGSQYGGGVIQIISRSS